MTINATTDAVLGSREIIPVDDVLLDLSLTSSLLGTVSGDSTFTRATIATVTDFEGLVKTVLSGESRFQGARRVGNIIVNGNSDAWTGVWYSAGNSSGGTGSSPVITPNFAPNPRNGEVTASRIVMDHGAGDTGADFSRSFSNGGTPPIPTPRSWRRTTWLRSNTGASYVLRWGGSGAATKTITVTPLWQRFDSDVLTNVYPEFIYFGDLNPGVPVADILMGGDLCEEVTGQANQNPSEYVSVGVESAPFHGAAVDGVRYFETENGNTVLSGVVTEATGSSLTTLDGYLAEGARENICLRSEEFNDAAWSKSNITIDANATVGPDGKTLANRFNVNATAAVHLLSQNIIITSAGSTQIAWYAKNDGGRFTAIRVISTANNWATVSYDLQLGTVTQEDEGATAGTVNSSDIKALPNGWFRLEANLTMPADTTVQMGLLALNTGTPTLDAEGALSFTPSAGEDYFIWGSMAEDNVSFPSSYVPTVAAAVTRNADQLSYVTAGNFSDTEGTAFATVEATDWGNAAGQILGDGTEAPLLADTTNSGIQEFDGTNTANGPFGTPSGRVVVTSNWIGAAMQAFADGAGGSVVPYDGSFSLSQIDIGQSGWFGTILDVKIHDRASTNEQIQNPDFVASLNTVKWDISIDSTGDILTADFFDTALLVSLYAEKRASESEVPDSRLRRGWIGNESFSDGFEIGSKIWLFEQARLDRDTLNGITSAAIESLQWLLDDGFAINLAVDTVLLDGKVTLQIDIFRPNSKVDRRFFSLWESSGMTSVEG